MARPGRGDGVELLTHDELQRQADERDDYQALNLSGAIDILHQLKSPGASAPAEAQDVVVEVEPEEEPAPSVFMADFFDEVKGVKSKMGTMRKTMVDVKELQSKIIQEVSKQKSKEYTEQLDDQLRQISVSAKQVKNNLQSMQHAGEEKFKDSKETSEARTHANMHAALQRKFVEIMGEFQEIQSNYKKHLRERVARQVKVANPAATEEEIEKAVGGGGGTSSRTSFCQGPTRRRSTPTPTFRASTRSSSSSSPPSGRCTSCSWTWRSLWSSRESCLTTSRTLSRTRPRTRKLGWFSWSRQRSCRRRCARRCAASPCASACV